MKNLSIDPLCCLVLVEDIYDMDYVNPIENPTSQHAMLTSYEKDTLKAFSNIVVTFKNVIIHLTCVGIIQIRTLTQSNNIFGGVKNFVTG